VPGTVAARNGCLGLAGWLLAVREAVNTPAAAKLNTSHLFGPYTALEVARAGERKTRNMVIWRVAKSYLSATV
jgi:hypothetical protein